MKNLKFWALICGLTFYLLPFTFYAYAQDSNKLVTLAKQIIEAKTNAELYLPFAELKDLYLKEKKFSEFIEFLNSLLQKKDTLAPFINYYIALGRYQQLKYLEETQGWDEYFNNGNAYRQELAASCQKAIAATSTKEPLHLSARAILWQFHKDQEDSFQEAALSDLMQAVLEYSQDAVEIGLIKELADELLSYNERAKAKELYKIYVHKLLTSDIKTSQLSEIAFGFYKEGNFELAQLIYDIYIEKIILTLPKEKVIPILIEIARLFTYTECRYLPTAPEASLEKEAFYGCFLRDKDALYAEKIFRKIEELGKKEPFTEGLTYLRAFNLEKARQYPEAKDIYLDLIQRYPATVHQDEAIFKLGIIYTYIFREIKIGRAYFERLAQKEMASPQVISSIYQLGLLKQWQEHNIQAGEFYETLLAKAKDAYKETVALTKERLKEIEEQRPIEYNLKVFLDASLKTEYGVFDATKVELSACPFRPRLEENTDICSRPYGLESGCMQPEVEYLWSGHLGISTQTEMEKKVIKLTKPTLEQSAFTTTYIHTGTKEINLVVVSPSGIIDRNIDMVDAE